MTINLIANVLGDVMPVIVLGFIIASAIVHIIFAIGVFQAATQRADIRGVFFAPPLAWSLATLLGGVFVATAFWFIHLSVFTHPNRHD